MICKDARHVEWIIKFYYKKHGKLLTTYCKIYMKNDHDICAIGQQNKAFEDQHNKAVGRKLAMEKALNELMSRFTVNDSPDRKTRKEIKKSIWESYFEQTKPLSKNKA